MTRPLLLIAAMLLAGCGKQPTPTASTVQTYTAKDLAHCYAIGQKVQMIRDLLLRGSLDKSYETELNEAVYESDKLCHAYD